jgi:hypothetical protein
MAMPPGILSACIWPATAIADWHGHVPDPECLADPRRRHGRNTGFWSWVTPTGTALTGETNDRLTLACMGGQ